MKKASILLLAVFSIFIISCSSQESGQPSGDTTATGEGIWVEIFNLFPERAGSMVKTGPPDFDSVSFFDSENMKIGERISLMDIAEAPEFYAGWLSSVYYKGEEAFGFIGFSYGPYLWRDPPWDREQWDNVLEYEVNGFDVTGRITLGYFHRRIVRVRENFAIKYGSSDKDDCTQFFDNVLRGMDFQKLDGLLEGYSVPGMP